MNDVNEGFDSGWRAVATQNLASMELEEPGEKKQRASEKLRPTSLLKLGTVTPRVRGKGHRPSLPRRARFGSVLKIASRKKRVTYEIDAMFPLPPPFSPVFPYIGVVPPATNILPAPSHLHASLFQDRQTQRHGSLCVGCLWRERTPSPRIHQWDPAAPHSPPLSRLPTLSLARSFTRAFSEWDSRSSPARASAAGFTRFFLPVWCAFSS